MKYLKHISLIITAVLVCSLSASAQVDRKDVRAGNRKFGKGEWKEADISYRKALVKDSLSVAANYNLANTLYRQQSFDEAGKMLEKIKDIAPSGANASDYYYNTGDVAVAQKNWQAAVDAFKEALLRDPADMDAKENYVYAKKMLEKQQQNGGGGDSQNKDNNQNQDNNQEQNQGDNKNDDQNKDQNKDQNQDQNQDNNNNQNNQGQNQQNQGNDGQGQQPVKISPQQAQQMLKAIQAKEKETQDKVNKEKADALKSRQKDKNW